jgi:hypothetical protein
MEDFIMDNMEDFIMYNMEDFTMDNMLMEENTMENTNPWDTTMEEYIISMKLMNGIIMSLKTSAMRKEEGGGENMDVELDEGRDEGKDDGGMGAAGEHLKLGRQWKVIVFHLYFVNRRVHIFKTKNLYRNDT